MKKILLLLTALTTLISCSEDPIVSDLTAPVVKQIDVTVMIPVHSSSLEYFDYVIRYTDNQGQVCNDTICARSYGIVVEDWQDGGSYEITLGSDATTYVRTFSYTTSPVSCMAEVTLIPKTDGMITCYMYSPKPYLYTNTYYSDLCEPISTDEFEISGAFYVNMYPDEFESAYGFHYITTAQVK